MASQGFPQFSDGDVEISLGGCDDTTLVLHSVVLALHSSWFKASLSDRWNHDNGSHPVNEKHRWYYVLQFDKGTDFAMLVRKPDSESISIPSGEVLEIETARGQDAGENLGRAGQGETVKAHYNLFCTLYHVALTYEDLPIWNARFRHMKLARLGRMYRCEAVVKLHIERHLCHCQNDILASCGWEPDLQLSLAYEVKSEWILKEAVTNLVGRSDVAYKRLRDYVQEAELGELLDRKRAEFVAALKVCEHKMYSIEPRKDGGSMAYMAVSLFQLWLSEKINKGGHGSGLQPGYANLYHAFWLHRITPKTLMTQNVDQRYLDRLICDLDEGDMMKLENELSLVIFEVTWILSPLMKDTRRREKGKEDEFRALTFIEIADDELPWSKP